MDPSAGEDANLSRAAYVAGVRRGFVLAVGVLPFGMVYGVAVARSDVDNLVGSAASVTLFAGASQLTLLDLHQGGAAWLVAVGTTLAINARFVLYSAALAPAFSEFPLGWRIALPHLMTDQAATLSIVEYTTETDPTLRRGFYFGAATILFVLWQVGTVIGVVVGAAVPDALQLGFIIPLMFTALVVPALTGRPAVITVVVSVAVTVATGGLPPGTNILVGSVAGLVAGALALGVAPTGTGAEPTP